MISVTIIAITIFLLYLLISFLSYEELPTEEHIKRASLATLFWIVVVTLFWLFDYYTK